MLKNQYDKCLKCEHLGNGCIPNLFSLSVEEIRQWAKKRKDCLGLTYAELAEKSGVPEGTIKNNFTKPVGDVYYTTYAPIMSVLVGCADDEPCHAEIANDTQKDETIARLENENKKLKEELSEVKTHYREDDKFYKKTIGKKNLSIGILSALLILSLLIIITALVIDRYNSDIGFFWIDNVIGFFKDDTGSYTNYTVGWRL